MIIAAVSAGVFGLMFDLGLNDIGRFHASLDYVYASSTMVLAALLLRQRLGLTITLQLFLALSYLTFISALVNVPADQFRGIWFYLLVFVAYLLGGIRTGLAYTLLSLSAITWVALTIDLQMQQETVVSMVLGLCIFSTLSFVYVRQSFSYADLIESKNQQLEFLASRDPLTGILNNRSYESRGDALLSLAHRSGEPLSLLYIDIDHFKTINDKYGHHIGDEVLVCMVKGVAKVIRESDVFARTGGEEFCILLPNTGMEGALALAEKVRLAIEGLECEVNQHSLKLTISIGVSFARPEDRALLDLEKRADIALYRAKASGRNRVCSEADSEP